jgi:competence protein ComEA
VAESKFNRLWTIIIILLLAITIVSALVAWTRYRPGQPIEIILPTEQESQGNIQIGGAVVNPGIYPFSNQDSIGSLVQSAGGVTSQAEPTMLQLHIPETGSQETPQKININRAEGWLLDALPGIGETRAKAIVAYREKNGPFKHISEIMQVEGIGQTLYEQIKELITVSE